MDNEFVDITQYNECPNCGSDWYDEQGEFRLMDIPMYWEDYPTYFECPDCRAMWDRLTGKRADMKIRITEEDRSQGGQATEHPS